MAEGARINLSERLAQFSERWSPKIVETVDDYDVKVVKVQGDFVWHKHDNEDELFLVLKGKLQMDFRDGHVNLGPGEIIVVPKGTEHKPCAEQECELLILERSGVVNTGDAPTSTYTQSHPERL